MRAAAFALQPRVSRRVKRALSDLLAAPPGQQFVDRPDRGQAG
jgi:hypothetical protein